MRKNRFTVSARESNVSINPCQPSWHFFSQNKHIICDELQPIGYKAKKQKADFPDAGGLFFTDQLSWRITAASWDPFSAFLLIVDVNQPQWLSQSTDCFRKEYICSVMRQKCERRNNRDLQWSFIVIQQVYCNWDIGESFPVCVSM